MNNLLKNTILQFSDTTISSERKEILNALVSYIQTKKNENESIRLNFICTHNSRRSHLSQIWAQTMAFYFNVDNVFCYSGGTEGTAMFPKVAETLVKQGFEISKLSETANPVYAVKFDTNEPAIICFSKSFDDSFNPSADFCAIMTCSSADEACPFIAGAELRLPIRYNDPKAFDGTDLMDSKYEERSNEIGQEMAYIFRSIK